MDRLFFHEPLNAVQIEVIVGILSHSLGLIFNSLQLFFELSSAASFSLEDLKLNHQENTHLQDNTKS